MSQNIAALFISISILLVGGLVFFINGTIDIDTLYTAVKISIPTSVVMGFLGFLIGRVLESSKTDDVLILENNSHKSYIDDLLVHPADLVKPAVKDDEDI